jgi:hypothetical protein
MVELRFNLVWFLHSDSPFLGKRKLLLAYQGCERGVANFYDLPGIPPQPGLDLCSPVLTALREGPIQLIQQRQAPFLRAALS